MANCDINDFDIEKECDYKGEHYSARDNGSVFRHPKPLGKLRRLDNKWTFGKPNRKTGYLMFSDIPVHRIIATAFLGSSPSQEYIVDHIDTNRQNNRPENLRWLTRLENILLNEHTRKKIEYHCGSVENFLNNPSLLPKNTSEKNFAWMRTVSKEEALVCLENMKKWLTKSNTSASEGSIGEWIFKGENRSANKFEQIYTESLTPTAIQESWKIPTEFLYCPLTITTNTPVLEYLNNIQFNKLCLKNKNYQSVAISVAITLDKKTMWVITHNAGSTKPWGLFRVTFEQNKFLHKNLGTFFEKRGAEKCLCLECGQKWYGPDGFDDYL